MHRLAKYNIAPLLQTCKQRQITIHFLTLALAGRLTPFSLHINWSTEIGRSILHINSTVSPIVISGLRGVTSTVMGGAVKKKTKFNTETIMMVSIKLRTQ